MFKPIIDFIKSEYAQKDFIPLHEPLFSGNEKAYLNECIDSTYVSSVGKFVDRFEEMMAAYTGAPYAIAVVNGTNALYLALKMAGVEQGDEVITQSLTFIATANAIHYTGAKPIFIDVDKETLGLSPHALEEFLKEYSIINHGQCRNKKTGAVIKACVPMHTFGHPLKIDKITEICKHYHIELIEDAAESLGSTFKGIHTGNYGLFGILSFNGNKTITTGGGGMILTSDPLLAKKAKHLTTQARVPHRWEFNHDEIGYNYRLPNINAALGCAQMEQLPHFIVKKREQASRYKNYCNASGYSFLTEPVDAVSNYWLNAIVLKDKTERDVFLNETNDSGVMTRPLWTPMHHLPMFTACQQYALVNTDWLADRVVNIPSSVNNKIPK